MQYNFNGVTIELKDKVCQLWNHIPGDIKPQTNLYVRASNNCNANCNFCEYHGSCTAFNFQSFYKVLRELRDRDIIGKIQITGGEPSIDGTKLYKICDTLRNYFPNTFIGINSNGYSLDNLKRVNHLVDNFAISRHHYDDKVNEEIFGTDTVPNEKSLREFIESVGEEKVHFSCNLIKGYIDNLDDVKKYLNKVSSMGINDVGFVTLMDINEYCKERQIKFDDSGIDSTEEFLKYHQYRKLDGCCKCANYIFYCAETNRLIDIYGRFVMNQNGSTGLISFDGYNLKNGFGGQIIM